MHIKTEKIDRYLTTLRFVLVGYCVLILNQNCFQMNNKTLASEGNNDTGVYAGKSECQFVSVPTLRSMLRNTLGLSQDDTAIIGANGAPTTNMYITSFQVSLGNPAPNAAADISCSALKYKLAAEIMINACTEAPSSTMQRLFPKGASDFTTLYLTFLGRNPTQEEVETLRQLVQSVSANVAERAVCAAVGSSLEVLARNI